jgi:hypothetical protein
VPRAELRVRRLRISPIRRNNCPKISFTGAYMIKLFPRYVLTLVLTALAAVLAPPGWLLAAPVADYPRLWLRAFSFDRPALLAWVSPSCDLRTEFPWRPHDGATGDAADDYPTPVRAIPRLSHA